MAGYSNKSLIQKLGIKAGMRASILAAPEGYDGVLGDLPDGLRLLQRAGKEMDFLHLFTKGRRDLEKRFAGLKGNLAQTGMLWISWPKKSSGVETDLNENIIRELGLKAGLVDVKVCAVDDTWSGLKFMYRRKDRK